MPTPPPGRGPSMRSSRIEKTDRVPPLRSTAQRVVPTDSTQAHSTAPSGSSAHASSAASASCSIHARIRLRAAVSATASSSSRVPPTRPRVAMAAASLARSPPSTARTSRAMPTVAAPRGVRGERLVDLDVSSAPVYSIKSLDGGGKEAAGR